MISEPLTLSELEQYLAKAADLLRGSIDQADFKALEFSVAPSNSVQTKPDPDRLCIKPCNMIVVCSKENV